MRAQSCLATFNFLLKNNKLLNLIAQKENNES